MLAEVVEVVDGEIAQGALPATLGVVVVDDGVAADRVHFPRSRRVCEISASTDPGSGGCAGRSANRWDGMRTPIQARHGQV